MTEVWPSSLHRSTSCFSQSCPPNSIACLYTELIFKQTQDNPEIDQEHSTFQICTYTFKDAIFARYTDGGNRMCSLLSQCLHSCTVPDLIQVSLDCSLGIVWQICTSFLLVLCWDHQTYFVTMSQEFVLMALATYFCWFLHHIWDISSPLLKLELQVNLVSSIVFLSCIPAKSINNFFRFFSRDASLM